MNDMPSRLPLNRSTILLLVLALAVIWFVPLGWRHLLPSDEGRYAEMAREMFLTGDWITPRYNGYKYFEKPPLQTWMNALTFAWFGIGEWQARLYTALTGFAGVLLIGFTGARVFNAATGVFAAIVLATSPYWNLMGHFNTLDMGLSFWMELTLCALLLAQRPNLPAGQVRLWMWLCWASMALAVLSKGLIGVILPGAVLVLYTLIARDWAVWKRLHLIGGVILFFAIATPWFVLVQQRNPEFLNFFFIVQQFKRYLTPEQNRPGAFYYFVPVILVGFLPWLSVSVQSIRHALRLPRQPNGFSPVTMMLVWTVFIFLFFSASHSKLLSYTLPIAPALALLIGLYLPLVTPAMLRRHLAGYAVFLVVAAVGALFMSRLGDDRNPDRVVRRLSRLGAGRARRRLCVDARRDVAEPPQPQRHRRRHGDVRRGLAAARHHRRHRARRVRPPELRRAARARHQGRHRQTAARHAVLLGRRARPHVAVLCRSHHDHGRTSGRTGLRRFRRTAEVGADGGRVGEALGRGPLRPRPAPTGPLRSAAGAACADADRRPRLAARDRRKTRRTDADASAAAKPFRRKTAAMTPYRT